MVETASCYPTEEQHERWRELADGLGMTKSDWMASMIEAGIKASRGFDPGVGADETEAELREHRNELRDELEEARSRVSELENRVYGAERREAERFVRENPGCTHSELVNHLQSTVPGRVPRLAEGLVVDERPDGRDGYYHPGDEGGAATDGESEYVAETGTVAHGGR
jgi:hypothetical protein